MEQLETFKALMNIGEISPLFKMLQDETDNVQKEEAIQAMKDLFAKLQESTTAEIQKILASTKQQIRDLEVLITEKTTSNEALLVKIQSAFKEQSDTLNMIRDKARNLKDGYTPIKGVDYFDATPADEAKIVIEVLKQIPVPVEETAEQLAEKLDSIDYLKKVQELEAKINAKIDAMPRHGGARSSHSMRFTDLSSQTNGTLKIFPVPEGLSGVLFSSDFPAVLMENNGFTLNKSRTQLTMTTDNAPSSGSQLLYQSTDIANY